MKHTRQWIMVAVVSRLVMGTASAQTTPLIKQGFEENVAGWTVFGMNARVATTNDPAQVKQGKGALQYDYTVDKGQMSALLLPVEPLVLAKMRSLRFWVKADYTTTVVVVLQEKDGGRYLTGFMAPKDQWQRVEVAPSDFTLTEGPDDPKDPNNKLDLDQVEAIAVSDIAQFFAQAGDALAGLFNVKTGAHTLRLDEFEATEEALSGTAAAAGDVQIGTFARPQISWLCAGDVKLSVATGKPLDGRGLQADYRQAQGKLCGLIKGFKRGSLTGMKNLALTVASLKPCKLIVQVEEVGGGKYNTMVDIPGGSEVKHISIPFAELGAAEDSKDANGKLDLDLVNQLVIIDMLGAAGLAGDQDNTLWINNIRATAK